MGMPVWASSTDPKSLFMIRTTIDPMESLAAVEGEEILYILLKSILNIDTSILSWVANLSLYPDDLPTDLHVGPMYLSSVQGLWMWILLYITKATTTTRDTRFSLDEWI
ncbi:hypothetical protein ACJX0J_029992 [Zea mays]